MVEHSRIETISNAGGQTSLPDAGREGGLGWIFFLNAENQTNNLTHFPHGNGNQTNMRPRIFRRRAISGITLPAKRERSRGAALAFFCKRCDERVRVLRPTRRTMPERATAACSQRRYPHPDGTQLELRHLKLRSIRPLPLYGRGYSAEGEAFQSSTTRAYGARQPS